MSRSSRERPDRPAHALAALEASRERIVTSSLRWLAVLGVVAYVPSVRAALRLGFWSVALVDTVAYAAVVGLTLSRIPIRLRALGLLAIFYALGLFLLIVFGAFGAGPIWLFSFSVLSAILFGFRGAAAGLAITVATLALVALSVGPRTLVPLPSSLATGEVWGIIAANMFFLAAVVSLSIAAILRDLRAAMEARQLAEARLLQGQKLEAIGTLAGGIAHDLNNVLQPILSYSLLIQRDLGDAHASQADIRMVLRAVERARELVRRVLVFSRKGERERRVVRVADVLSESLALLRPSLPASIEVVQSMECALDTVEADPVELQQIIMNLCNNGAFAMRERGGRLVLRLEAQSSAEPLADLDPSTAMGLRLTVTDTGEGMTQETMDRAFEPFFTTKAPGEGTGLGLSSVHGIVSSLGGSIRLSSTVGVGTSVEVLLPLARTELLPADGEAPAAGILEVREPAAAATIAPTSGAPSAHSTDESSSRSISEPLPAPRRVLLVDDEPAVRLSTGRLLTRLGCTVTACDSGAAALAALRAEPGAFDLLLTDLNMPVMTGIELAHEVRVVQPGLPVLLATGFLDEGDVRQTKDLAAFAVLSKPFNLAELDGMLRGLVAADETARAKTTVKPA